MEQSQWSNRESIRVQGEDYKPMNLNKYNECYDIFDIIDKIQSMEYAPYKDKYLLKKRDKYRMCEKNNFNNITEI